MGNNLMMELETKAVIEAIKSGSEKILLMLYEQYRSEFISWSTNLFSISSEDAKDCFQEVLLSFYRNVRQDKVKECDSSLKTYLFGIGKNIILNQIRRKDVEAKVLGEYVSDARSEMEEDIEIQHMIDIVKRIYKVMGSPCKDILSMYYEQNFDMESIALRMGYKNADVAKKKKYECLKSLESRFKINHYN